MNSLVALGGNDHFRVISFLEIRDLVETGSLMLDIINKGTNLNKS